ncbi:DNA-directed RNA polymerase II subunit rpb1-like [Daphnia carinata]|uniref:DNA-directed RNA polymerase II subunit rpb1-like n=1 Tax=Daphnia carinata TaxID=120202 RepID=UPI00257C5C56|nr:DNA-directed RNA polymerase II subunit rpb1-like [Daphnia carinata]
MKLHFVTLFFSAVVASTLADGPTKIASSLRKKGSAYFQYASAPSQSEYEYGYNLGNPFHRRNLFHQTKDHRFRTKLMWDDSVGGTGEHYWEFNHGDAGSDASAPAYPSGPSYSSPTSSYSSQAPSYSAPSSHSAPSYSSAAAPSYSSASAPSYSSATGPSFPAGDPSFLPPRPSFTGNSPFFSAAAPSFSDASRRYSEDFATYNDDPLPGDM